MSHHVAVSHLPPEGEQLQTSKFTFARVVLALIGAAGLAAAAAIFLTGGATANSFAYSWLFALEVFFTLTAGALFWALLHNASNSSWGVVIRRVPENLAQSFPVLFLLSIPLFMPLVEKPEWTQNVWEWIGIHEHVKHNFPEGITDLRDALAVNHDTLLLYKKYPYLHMGFDSVVPGWDLRVIIFFGLLAFTAWKLRQYSLHQDATGDVQTTFSARRFSCGMLPVFAVCSTFASIDWIKSLNYKWFSTMFGVNVFAGSALAAMALIILVVGTLVKTGHLKKVVTGEHFHLMGKLMLAFVIFWAYIAFSQFFLIWYANIPEETQWYALRNTGSWWYISLGLTFLHFVLPFILLLKRDTKKNVNYIMFTAAFVILMHMMELYWMIIPERGPVLYDFTSAPDSATFFRDFGFDALAFVTFGAIYAFLFLGRMAKTSIYPCGDPRLEESVNVIS